MSYFSVDTSREREVLSIQQEADPPMVSICTAAYNHEKYIARAIESVLAQQVDFRFEMVIGEDNSDDSTRAICERYAKEYPGIIRLLPAEQNLGMSRNGIRILGQCAGKYVAILDGDDYWDDPHKLRDQVAFLESDAEYGMIYSDIQPVDAEGFPCESAVVDERRMWYREGDVFTAMLAGDNFVNSCTALFRRSLLELGQDAVDRYWYSFDFWYWLRISMRSKVKFMDRKTACYRIHAGGITQSAGFSSASMRRMYFVLYDVLENYHAYRRIPVSATERRTVFRKLLSLLYRSYGTAEMKRRVLWRIPRYFPGLGDITGIVAEKITKQMKGLK